MKKEVRKNSLQASEVQIGDFESLKGTDKNIEFILTYTDNFQINKYELSIYKRKGTFRDAFQLFAQEDYDLNVALHNIFTNSTFDAIFWECPPVTKTEFDTKTFEFVIINAPRLAHIEADIRPFKDHFITDSKIECERMRVTSFLNLGRDSLLVVPCPLPPLNLTENKNHDYKYFAHLLSYVKGPYYNKQVINDKPIKLKNFDHHKYTNHQIQVVDLFKLLGEKVISTIQKSEDHHKKYWISTSGLGVSWLHIRIDTYPKYYNYEEYKT